MWEKLRNRLFEDLQKIAPAKAFRVRSIKGAIESCKRILDELNPEDMFLFCYGLSADKQVFLQYLDESDLRPLLKWGEKAFEGDYQVFIADKSMTWTIIFCHEGDIHVHGKALKLVMNFLDSESL